MRSIDVRAAAWIFATLCLLMPATAVGQADEEEQTPSGSEQQTPSGSEQLARHHFEQGVALFREEALESALTEFRTSYSIRPLPHVLYNIGIVERSLGRYAQAVETLQQYLIATEGTDESDERRDAIRALVVELEAVLGDLVIESEPEGADLFVDGELQGQTPQESPLRLEAGEHDIELRLDGYHTHRSVVEVQSQAEQRQRITLEPLPPPPIYRRWWFWTTIGVVTTGVILAVVLPFTITPEEADFGTLQIVRE